jgi:excinuclease ABC subunit C
MSVDRGSIDLPNKPGVYLFKRVDEDVMYVGKATDLEARVSSYFSNNPDREMIPRLVSESDRVDFIVTKSPSEALILERQLIRKHKPKFNSLLKDDKSFPFIALTSHDLPRILYSRHPPKDSRRWGPFSDAGAAKKVVELLRRFFGIRDNRNNLPFGYIESGDPDDYQRRVKAVVSILDGDAGLLIRGLQDEMDEHSSNLRYEAAARSRNLIASVNETISQRAIHSRFYQDCDAIGFASTGDTGMVTILHAKEGVVEGQTEYPLIHRGDISESVSRVLVEHYSNRKPPKRILVPSTVGESLVSWLKDVRGSSVEVRTPKRGDLAELRGMADKNAEILVRRSWTKGSGNLEQKAADDAARLIGLDTLNHLVCFDMAQLQGIERVGASVVFRNGRPSKKEYRTYRVKTEANDDLRMMSEVIERWLKHQDEWPDLLLLDGGETHLSTIGKMLERKVPHESFTLASLAKREETLHIQGMAPLVLDRRGRVLIHSRDEAHRFVNQYHRKRRSKGALRDPLEDIDGLGAKKIQSLLRHFGGRSGIEHASVADLRRVPGIGESMAERIREHFHR